MTTDPTPGIDLWTAPITAGGATATPEQMREAWKAWSNCGCRTAGTLAAWLTRLGVTGANRLWPTDRLSGVMLQRARKAGVIRYVKGKWEIVDG